MHSPMYYLLENAVLLGSVSKWDRTARFVSQEHGDGDGTAHRGAERARHDIDANHNKNSKKIIENIKTYESSTT